MDNLIKKIKENTTINDDTEHLKRVMETKEPIQMDEDELKYATKPIGRTHLSSKKIEDKTKRKYKYIECNVCGKKYCTNNAGKHRRTQYHLVHENLNNKLKKILLS